MALTTAQRMQVRMYTGWSERFHQTDSALEQAMNALDLSPSVDAEAQIIVILGQLAAIDSRLTDALDRLKAVKIGSIELDAPREIAMIRSEGRRLVGRIASLLGVEVRHDVYSPMGPSLRAAVGGMVPGGSGHGGMPPMG